MEVNFNWYAIQTRYRSEKKIAGKLAEKGIEFYAPLQKRQSNWSDRKKIILEPVFKGLLFVKLPENRIWEVKTIAGIVNYVYWLGKPAVIREQEIETIKKFLNEFENAVIENAPIQLNDKVRITQGPLMNYEGILLDLSGSKAIIKIESMGLFLSAHINKNNLESLINSNEERG